VTEAFRRKLDGWPRIKGNKDLLLFSDLLEQVKVAQGEISGLGILDDCRENRNLLKKLPVWLVRKWNGIIFNRAQSGYPKFSDFAKFIQTEAKIANNPITSGLDEEFTRDKRSPKKQEAKCRATLATTTKKNKEDRQRQTPPKVQKQERSQTSDACWCCKKNNHGLDICHFFKGYDMNRRVEFIKKNNLCFGCLGSGHRSKYCGQRATCGECGKKHPTLLHRDIMEKPELEPKEPGRERAKEPDPDDTHSAVNLRVHSDAESTSMIVPVRVSTEQGSEVFTYALLDTQSDASFIQDDLARSLSLEQQPVRLKLSTMTSSSSVSCGVVSDLLVKGVNLDTPVRIRRCYTRDHIPSDRRHIPTRNTAEAWPHLQHLAREMLALQDFEVGLLIGYNCPQALAPKETVVGGESEPYAIRTDLGWSIVGSVDSQAPGTSRCFRVATREIPLMSPKEILTVLESDFSEDHGGKVSQEDLRFLEIMESGVTRTEGGHVMMPLPFKKSEPIVPNNRSVAEARLRMLKKRLTRDDKYRDCYLTFMKDIIAKEEVEEVTNPGQPGKVWYIPHHGVFHPKKPDKLRVVFDGSAVYKSTSLNEHLMTGPNLTNSLTGVLCRFREHPIAFMGDVERMFHQFLVKDEHRDYLRFLWWKSDSLDAKPTEFRMKVHLFGAASSPGCANFGLKHLARENAVDLPDAARFIEQNFYVDDGLDSCKTQEEAIKLIADAQELCQRGGLRLHKFVSNSREVMDAIEPSERSKSLVDVDLTCGHLPVETALGIHWLTEEDAFSVVYQSKDSSPTRRGILSAIASTYDPLGFVAPFVLNGKLLLQQMCKAGIGWDDQLPSDLLPQWEAWRTDCPNLEQVKIPRCYQPTDLGAVRRVELHHFSDASYRGYGQCSYLRFVGQDRAHCALICGKARVAPLNIATIPRLELTAALVSALIARTLREELRIPVDAEYFWTDSRVVLGYISNEARRFHVFVANRVQRIRQITEPEQWLYVQTDKNPADHASRGTSVSDLVSSNWFQGPEFLQDVAWEPTQEEARLTTGDPEVRNIVLKIQAEETPLNLQKRLEKFSNWTSMVTALTVLKRAARRGNARGMSLVQERVQTEKYLIKVAQGEAFSQEIDLLTGKRSLQHTSKLFSLNPYVGEDGLLRVGGRLGNSSLQEDVKNPIILPKNSPVTRAILSHLHKEIQHQGRGQTLNEIRSRGYWIVRGSRAVADMIQSCVVCRRLRRPPEEQRMADLPVERVEPSAPFTYAGMDVFGPFMVKRGRSEHKRYGLVFTCLCSRAIHLEMLEDMSTDSFINSLRCFIAIRGAVKQLRCDQGSNFVGAKNEFKSALKTMDPERVQRFLAEQHCEFVMNAPSSSHAGGVWERQIRTVRNVLEATLGLCPGRLDDPSLRTYLYEAMAIVNSRPLSVTQLNDASAPEPLTPNHVLQMKSRVALPPPGSFVKEDLYLRKRWRRVQHLCEVFWGRWKGEYLLSLNERSKWNTPRRNVRKGDIVMVVDHMTPRMEWPLARVTEAEPSEDGLVRRVKVAVSTRRLDKHGRRTGDLTELERPIQKLVLLKTSEEAEES